MFLHLKVVKLIEIKMFSTEIILCITQVIFNLLNKSVHMLTKEGNNR